MTMAKPGSGIGICILGKSKKTKLRETPSEAKNDLQLRDCLNFGRSAKFSIRNSILHCCYNEHLQYYFSTYPTNKTTATTSKQQEWKMIVKNLKRTQIIY